VCACGVSVEYVDCVRPNCTRLEKNDGFIPGCEEQVQGAKARGASEEGDDEVPWH
jgi:hypothetical protein